MELCSLDRISGDTAFLMDGDGRLDCIEEGHRPGLTGAEGNGLRNFTQDHIGRHMGFRDFVTAHRDVLQKDAACGIGGSGGGEIAVDLLDFIGHIGNGRSVLDIFLQNFKAGFHIVLKMDFAGLSRAQSYGLLCLGDDIRFLDRLLFYHIHTRLQVVQGGSSICTNGDGSGVATGNGFDGVGRAGGDGHPALGVRLDDLHGGQFLVGGRYRVSLIPIGHIYIDTVGRGVQGIAFGSLYLHKGIERSRDSADCDIASARSHIAADDLAVTVDVEHGAIQTAGGAIRHLAEGDGTIAGRRLRVRGRIIPALGFIPNHQLSGEVAVEEGLAATDAGFGINSPFGAVILYHRGNHALGGVFLDLLLIGRILLGLLIQHPIDVAEIGFIGVRVGETAGIHLAVTTGLHGLMVPDIGLKRHEQAAGDLALVVYDVGHHPLGVGQFLGVQFPEAALGEGGVEHTVSIFAGGAGVGIAVEEGCG